LPNIIKIDPYNFELNRFKVGRFLRHSVVILLSQINTLQCSATATGPINPKSRTLHRLPQLNGRKKTNLSSLFNNQANHGYEKAEAMPVPMMTFFHSA